MGKHRSIHQYSWNRSFNNPNDVPAQLVGEYLETFGDRITVDDVVHDGSKRTSLLHKLFTWDDARAADAHRRFEARQLMAHLELGEGNERKRAYVSATRQPGGRAYFHVTKVTGEEIELKAMRELRAWVRRYRGVKAMASIVMRVSPLVQEEEEESEVRVVRRRA